MQEIDSSTHTPGPWYAQSSQHIDVGLLIKPIPGYVVAVCDPLPNMQANAHLLAASPELLSELTKADQVMLIIMAHLTDEQKMRLNIDLANRGLTDHEQTRRTTLIKATGMKGIPPDAWVMGGAAVQPVVRPA